MTRQPVLIVIAGPNGSGKTTITEALLRHQWAADCAAINPDDLAEKLFKGWDPLQAAFKAAVLAAEMRERHLAAREDLVFETVFSAPDKLDYLRRAKAAGYFIRLFFICTDNPLINAARVARRMALGGHPVPLDKIVGRYRRSIANGAAALQVVDRLYLFDNSREDRDAREMLRFRDGVLVRRSDPVHAWAHPFLERP